MKGCAEALIGTLSNRRRRLTRATGKVTFLSRGHCTCTTRCDLALSHTHTHTHTHDPRLVPTTHDSRPLVKLVHIGCKSLNCDLACNKIMNQQERLVFSIVPILLLILLLRRARRIRFLLTYNYLDLEIDCSTMPGTSRAKFTKRKRSTHKALTLF